MVEISSKSNVVLHNHIVMVIEIEVFRLSVISGLHPFNEQCVRVLYRQFQQATLEPCLFKLCLFGSVHRSTNIMDLKRLCPKSCFWSNYVLTLYVMLLVLRFGAGVHRVGISTHCVAFMSYMESVMSCGDQFIFLVLHSEVEDLVSGVGSFKS